MEATPTPVRIAPGFYLYRGWMVYREDDRLWHVTPPGEVGATDVHCTLAMAMTAIDGSEAEESR